MSARNDASLIRAIAKLQSSGRESWGAALTPAEIICLVEAGAKAHLDSHVARAREKASKGESDTTWFYFSPRKDLRAQILKRKS